MHRHAIPIAAALFAASVSAYAVEPTARAIEYRQVSSGLYRLITDPSEAALLDAGSSWVRTGGAFGIFAKSTDAAGLAPVCQFMASTNSARRFLSSSAAECAAMQSNPAWFELGTSFYVMPTMSGTCATGNVPVYRTLDTLTQGYRLTVDASYNSRAAAYHQVSQGVGLCATPSSDDRTLDAYRLLRQASFGPTPAEVQRVVNMGAAAWIDEQIAMPGTRLPDYPWVPANKLDTCVDDRTLPLRADSYCARDNYSLFPLQLAFLKNALGAPDQLRQRVAFALSQIFVVSGVKNSRNYAVQRYQNVLGDYAFGNYYDLLYSVTVSPVMGDYLDMGNNNKASGANGTEPNENYAREILQLFSIGTALLNADGTTRTDAQGVTLASYDQEVIEGYAHAFTGWTYQPVQGVAAKNNNPRNFLGAMYPVAATHDLGAKEVLDARVLPAGQTADVDLAQALQAIFLHPNVGPFICKQLIQKLVTSDPTPAYVARVSAAFANDGAGHRGNLAAVVKAILLDPEARGANRIDPAYGKLQEPVFYLTHMARALNASTDAVYFRGQAATLSQNVYYSPSVFNYYPAEYQVPGIDRIGPEFGLLNTGTAIARANVANTMLYSTIAPDTSVFGSTGTQVNIAAYAALASDASRLADRVGLDVLGAPMSAPMKAAVVSAVNAVAVTDTNGRARAALYLVFASPQFQVQR